LQIGGGLIKGGNVVEKDFNGIQVGIFNKVKGNLNGVR